MDDQAGAGIEQLWTLVEEQPRQIERLRLALEGRNGTDPPGRQDRMLEAPANRITRAGLLRTAALGAAAAAGAGVLLGQDTAGALADSPPTVFTSTNGATALTGQAGSSGGDGVHGQAAEVDFTGVYGNHTGGGKGVFGSTNSTTAGGVEGHNDGAGPGVRGTSNAFVGVLGKSDSSTGVHGESTGGWGVYGHNLGSNHGVVGDTTSKVNAGVLGNNFSSGPGVHGTSNGGPGLLGESSTSAPAIHGTHTGGGIGVYAESSGGSGQGLGLWASGYAGVEAYGSLWGVYGSGEGNNSIGVYGDGSLAPASIGVRGDSDDGSGVRGTSVSGAGGSFSSSSGPQLHLDAHGTAGAPTAGTHVLGDIWLDKNAALWVCVTGGSPGTWKQVQYSSVTAARVTRFRARRQDDGVTFSWRLADEHGIAGFDLYAGAHRLTPQPIPLQGRRTYRHRVPWKGGGPFALHVLTTDGRVLTVRSG